MKDSRTETERAREKSRLSVTKVSERCFKNCSSKKREREREREKADGASSARSCTWVPHKSRKPIKPLNGNNEMDFWRRNKTREKNTIWER